MRDILIIPSQKYKRTHPTSHIDGGQYKVHFYDKNTCKIKQLTSYDNVHDLLPYVTTAFSNSMSIKNNPISCAIVYELINGTKNEYKFYSKIDNQFIGLEYKIDESKISELQNSKKILTDTVSKIQRPKIIFFED